MIVYRVEKHIMKSDDPYYKMFDDFCFKSKNLYNHANYLIRNEFVKNGRWLRARGTELKKMLREDAEYPDYRQMPTSQTACMTLDVLDANWKSFFASIKDWSKHKDKYLGRPKLPSYKPKDGRFVLTVYNQEARLRDGIIKFPKTFNGFTLTPKFVGKDNFVGFQQLRVIPHRKHLVFELVYKVEVPDEKLEDNGKYISIDLGVDNLATITNNIGLQPVIINGKGLKSQNKYYNKQISHYRELAKRMNNLDYTNRMNRLTVKRNDKINDYLHKASKFVIDYALKNDVHTIVIGNNKNWKQNSEMSKAVNQSFVQIPHSRLIEMIQYKAEGYGINVVINEESYSSGTSFLDNEEPTKENYNKSRRVHRGLFVSNCGIRINADVNGSLQIMKKVFPNAFADGIEGLRFSPVRVNVA